MEPKTFSRCAAVCVTTSVIAGSFWPRLLASSQLNPWLFQLVHSLGLVQVCYINTSLKCVQRGEEGKPHLHSYAIQIPKQFIEKCPIFRYDTHESEGVLSQQSSAQTDRKPKESLSSGINVINASDDATFPTGTPDTVNPAGLIPLPLQPPAGLCGSVRYPSLPGSLDLTSELSEIQKHVSDPALPVTWSPAIILWRTDTEEVV